MILKSFIIIHVIQMYHAPLYNTHHTSTCNLIQSTVFLIDLAPLAYFVEIVVVNRENDPCFGNGLVMGSAGYICYAAPRTFPSFCENPF